MFAQLITGGESAGRARASRADPRRRRRAAARASRIEDCGLKAGLNGVDNGRLYFDHVRVPRENLLNRYGDVDADGTTRRRSRTRPSASSPCSAPWSRAGSAWPAARGSAAKVALAIAVRYGEVRRQFTGPGVDGEIVLLDYLAHQRKLLPALAKHLRAALRAARARRRAARDVRRDSTSPRRRPTGRGRRPARARGAGGRHQGDRRPGTPRDTDPGLPRGVRRRRLPGREPAPRAQGRHRRLHHLRGRQHGAAAAGRQGAADRLSRPLRRARLARHGAVRRRPGRRDGRGTGRRRRVGCSACSTPRPGATTRRTCSTARWHLELFDFRERHLLETRGPPAAARR